MTKRLLSIGAGFAGTDAALSSARLRELKGASDDDFEIAVLAPQPALTIRPRLYEPEPQTLQADLKPLFDAVGVTYIQGEATGIDAVRKSVAFSSDMGRNGAVQYDCLVIATGSSLFRPPVPGLSEYAHSVDSLPEAVALDRHLKSLAATPNSLKRNTVVVGGGGFTGIEVATEMPSRLRAIFGDGVALRVVLVERSDFIAPDMGDDARPYILKALNDLQIETITGAAIASIDPNGATLSTGQRLDAATVVWSAGMRANPLTMQIAAERDNFGRLIVDRNLAVPGVASIYAAGDAAKASSDDAGNYALMSCQHAKRLGAFAGNNAAAGILGAEPEPYHQRVYVTCLDLGEAGALFTRGWDRKVELTGANAKALKKEINTVWIYPPEADKAAALQYAKPSSVVDL
jgi:NADH dehydrogenase